ncbi:MAG: sodium:calcium antiporter [Candidatus Diapherotrites archaeon]|nr:sodium:calcium antiporter [Candidatus Diapherotrites archaeon]
MLLATVLLLLLISLLLLFLSGDRVVLHGKRIAASLGVGSFSFALLFVSVGTSLPEIVVSVVSSLEGYPEVVVGDVLGSNVTDLLLILGIYSLLLSRRLDDNTLSQFLASIAFAGMAFVYALMRETLNFVDGLILLLLFFLFVRERLPSEEMERQRAQPQDYVVFVLSLVTLVLSAYAAVNSVVILSHLLSLPLFVLSLLTVALGTSLPELAVGLNAIRRGEYSMALGDVAGSLAVNTTLGLGLASFIVEIPILLWEERFVIFLLLLASFIVLYRLSTRKTLDRALGLSLIFLYVVYLTVLLQSL